MKIREEVPILDTWRLEDFFETNEEFQAEIKSLENDMQALEAFHGTLSTSADRLADCLDLYQALSVRQERIFVYANMRLNQDEANTTYMGLADMAISLVTKLSALASFVNPEILSIEDETFETFMQNERLHEYTHALDKIRKIKNHMLDESGEYLMALASEALGAADDIFTVLTNADMSFGTIIDDKGEEVSLTTGRFYNFLQSPDGDFRKRAFEQYYNEYGKWINTLATTYKSNIQADMFVMRARNYPSVLESNLLPKDIPVSVYDTLVHTVRSYLPALHRYVALRKEILGVDTLYDYDLYAPLVKDVDATIPYDKAVETITASLQPLGKDYLAALHTCFTDRWVDKFENKGKSSGAYSWGAYAVHPYILMNYDNQISDMFTLAHEAGHALHRHFSIEAQPMIYYNCDIFTAEVASTFNETMLVNYLLDTEEDIEMKKYLLNYMLGMFSSTVFRQVQFAEFEQRVYAHAEQGHPIEAQFLNNLYDELNKDYYGPAVEFSKDSVIEWARIPHFYNSFYVYQYATGFASAISLSMNVLNGGKEEVDRYINFLKAGSHKYPIDLLQDAGIDMKNPMPIKKALDVFVDTLEQFENLIK